MAYNCPYMNDIQKRAVDLHAAGSGCAQAVFCSFASELGFDFASAHRYASGFGGGMGRCQLVCGAVSGGVMALGAAFGSDKSEDLEAKDLCYAKVNAFIKAMEKDFGYSDCKSLLGIDISTEEGRARVKEEGLAAKVCDKLIARAIELVQKEIAKS